MIEHAQSSAGFPLFTEPIIYYVIILGSIFMLLWARDLLLKISDVSAILMIE